VRALELPAVAAAAWALPAPAPHVPALCRALGIERRRAGPEASVWLTFDDGPHPRGTPAVLEALAREACRATFFLVGEQVERRPGLAAEIAAAGHEIALHGHRHRLLLRIGPHALRDDFDRGGDAIAAATGRGPTLHRAPYGVYSLGALAELQRRRWTPLLWSRWGRDWRRRATPATITRDATAGIKAGDVVLLHDADFYSVPGSWRATAEAVPRILEALATRGLRRPTV
jgi:peptidoglycan/xylan/chitin deacetylase (PgdA/CDA1 family)